MCFLAGLLALAGSLFFPHTLVQLSVLSYEGLAQLVPTVLLALYWRRMTAPAAVAGLLSGLAVMTALWATGNDPWHGVNGGIIALAVNLLVTLGVTLSRPAAPVRPPRETAPRETAGAARTETP